MVKLDCRLDEQNLNLNVHNVRHAHRTGGGRPGGGRPSAAVRPENFEQKMARFMKDSEERLSTLKRATESKRGGRGQEEGNLLAVSIKKNDSYMLVAMLEILSDMPLFSYLLNENNATSIGLWKSRFWFLE